MDAHSMFTVMHIICLELLLLLFVVLVVCFCAPVSLYACDERRDVTCDMGKAAIAIHLAGSKERYSMIRHRCVVSQNQNQRSWVVVFFLLFFVCCGTRDSCLVALCMEREDAQPEVGGCITSSFFLLFLCRGTHSCLVTRVKGEGWMMHGLCSLVSLSFSLSSFFPVCWCFCVCRCLVFVSVSVLSPSPWYKVRSDHTTVVYQLLGLSWVPEVKTKKIRDTENILYSIWFYLV